MPDLFLAVVTSYLLGSLPTGFLVVKWMKRVDVRTVGSGNIGATNVTRAAGKGAGAAVFLLDLAKGWLAARVIAPPAYQLACGLAAILGHDFPIFLRFRGGKGVATTMGVWLAVAPVVAGVAVAVWLGGFLLFRYVSVGSLAAAVTIPVTQLSLHASPSDVMLSALIALLMIVRHRANIVRLLQGKEHRVTL